MSERLRDYIGRLENLARERGLDYFPVEFELVPPAFMMEIAVYGLPVRMPHWSFGVRYIYQLVQHRMGHSRIFEVVFPGNPGRAYLSADNTVDENTLVVAHVLGHADFSKNNLLFRRSQDEVGYHIVEQAASHAKQITGAIEEYGQRRVEAVLDAALSLEQNIDMHQGLRRERYPEFDKPHATEDPDEFHQRYDALTGSGIPAPLQRRRLPLPPHEEFDLLWFIATYAPELDGWERDILLAVREESFYFYPVFACQIMNEGWASYWHARLLRDAEFLPPDLYLEAAKTHSDVVRPYAGSDQVALSLNPYHLGFSIWEHIIKERGVEVARRIMEEEDDFGFIRNYLTEDLAHELSLFRYHARRDGEVLVDDFDIHALHEAILAPKFNFGTPRISVDEVKTDGTLKLRHHHEIDQRGLDLPRAQRVMEYIQKLWRRPVVLYTVDSVGREEILREDGT
ncbi:MAG: SpoVR family protein [Gammaproteobacteria bacterium]|nr:SpoVR family protein [Gammaproteobacteria bacterium]